ncbi:hypothetical protein Y032_0035g3128 [Ancylostoma ceylanicum]|uniref:Uncharacterized protein n=1 Tax=Ancylostoma ceylanicum TaxID=53326 RepID=A0A016ULN1_9BILA|nr:hypothetical protein Y032_0035g3128 [Ancylostoma ceylanicum]
MSPRFPLKYKATLQTDVTGAPGLGRMARFLGWRYRQAGPGTRYYHPCYGHASRLCYNESSNNSSTSSQSSIPYGTPPSIFSYISPIVISTVNSNLA